MLVFSLDFDGRVRCPECGDWMGHHECLSAETGDFENGEVWMKTICVCPGGFLDEEPCYGCVLEKLKDRIEKVP